MEKVLVIGGSNIDFLGKVKDEFILRDSNIGEIEISFGGVARNITENLARLGLDVTFVTAIGSTYLDKALKEELLQLGVNVIVRDGNYKTSNYLAIHDNKKDMIAALCDQHINDAFDLSYLSTLKDLIQSFSYIVIDTNLDEEKIGYILSMCEGKIVFMDAISTQKALRLKKYVQRIDYLKCNLEEAQSLFQHQDIDEIFHLSGKNLIISDGTKDILYKDRKNKTNYQAYPVTPLKEEEIVNLTGAGDALLSGIIFGIVNGYTLKDAISLGTKVSCATIRAQGATSKEDLSKYIKKE
jgi:pseudouridine kinase